MVEQGTQTKWTRASKETVPARPPGKLTFDGLIEEVKALIVDQVLRPTDLKNLCLVNRQLHRLAVKPLYQNVALDVGSPSDNRLSAFLSPRNIGLKHIRQIRLYLAKVPDRCNQQQQAHLVSRMILEFLPEDILEEFSWCPWTPFSADNLLLLYRKQRKMKWLEVMDLDRSIMADLVKREKEPGQLELYQGCRKLALYPENRETLRLCQYFVQRTVETVEEMILHANFHNYLDPRDPPQVDTIESRELNDSATAPGLLTSTIFEHMMPFDKCTPFANLNNLRLHKVSLRYCADTWCKTVDFTRIQYLKIYQCLGTDALFAQLSKADNLPKRLELLELQHKDNSDNEALLALDGFLCLVSGIQDLSIDLGNVKALPAAAGIARHGKTLETLNVHCWQDPTSSISSTEDGELVWDIDDFEKICKACTGLEQLSCAWPETSLIRSPEDEWRAYERVVCRHLREMVTLHISTWPSNKPSTNLLPRSVYEHLLQGLAQQTFKTASLQPALDFMTSSIMNENTDTQPSNQGSPSIGSKFHLIAFGISDKIYEREDSKNQILFLKSTCQDAMGKTQTYAAPIGWCLRQYVEPKSEVLDFVLHRQAAPPCRDGGARDGMISGWGGDGDDEFD